MKKTILLLSLAFVALNTIVLHAQALPDSAFSIWKHNTNPSYNDPNPMPLTGNGWQDVNIVSSPLWGASPVSCFKDSVRFNSPPYSARIVAVALNSLTAGLLANDLGGRDTIGIMFLGTGQPLGWPFTMGYPYTGRPASLDFFYEYAPSGIDTAFVGVMLTKWNVIKSQEDTVAMGTLLINTPVALFTMGSVPLNYTANYLSSGNPDTAQVLFSACNFLHINKAQPGSTLWVDDIKWSGVVTNTPNPNSISESVNTYPNPANTKITFSFSNVNASKLEVYDITGKELNTCVVLNRSLVLNTSYYSSGVYIYKALDNSGVVLKVGKFNVVR